MQAESLEEMSAWLNYIEQAAKYVPNADTPGTPRPDDIQEPFEEETSEVLKAGEDEDDAPVVHSKLSPQEEEELAQEEARNENPESPN